MDGAGMKVVSLIFESFNRTDLEAAGTERLDGWHVGRSFSMAPARCSVTALFCLQTGARSIPRRFRGRLFREERGAYLGDRIRQRIISSSWPAYCNARRFDPEANARGHRVGEGAKFTLDRFLREEFYRGDVDHLVFWGRIGHVGVRAGRENRGVPNALVDTWNWNLDFLEEWVFPLIDFERTLVIAHPDHGSARRGLSKRESLHDGFVISNRPIGDVRSWGDLSTLIEGAVSE